jgi:hypothetical protein
MHGGCHADQTYVTDTGKMDIGDGRAIGFFFGLTPWGLEKRVPKWLSRQRTGLAGCAAKGTPSTWIFREINSAPMWMPRRATVGAGHRIADNPTGS